MLNQLMKKKIYQVFFTKKKLRNFKSEIKFSEKKKF